jgi:hypothetical protein
VLERGNRAGKNTLRMKKYEGRKTYIVDVTGGAHVILKLLPRRLVRKVADVHAQAAGVPPRFAGGAPPR